MHVSNTDCKGYGEELFVVLGDGGYVESCAWPSRSPCSARTDDPPARQCSLLGHYFCSTGSAKSAPYMRSCGTRQEEWEVGKERGRGGGLKHYGSAVFMEDMREKVSLHLSPLWSTSRVASWFPRCAVNTVASPSPCEVRWWLLVYRTGTSG